VHEVFQHLMNHLSKKNQYIDIHTYII
jgi:hypothetical protein